MKHLLLCLAIAAALPAQAQEQALARIAAQPAVKQALAYIEKNEPLTQKNMLAINAIPAPTFAEAARARDYEQRLKAAGLADVHIDEAGNVLGFWRGSGKGPTVVLAAHLDTVYPAATDLTVREKDGRLYAPGIADNGRSLAAMLAIAQALSDAKVQTEGDVLFVANVGEEGLGDLKGVKHLFRQRKDIKAFVGLEPALGTHGDPVTYMGAGSRRFKVTIHGPGGHSYESFGLPSAVHAAGRVIARIDDVRVPAQPKVTFNVGVVQGGQSVNSISAEASLLIDIRSADAALLAKVEQQIKDAIQQGVNDTNQRWNSKAISADVALIGDRPAGKMAEDAVIVRTALAAAKVQGRPALLDAAHSTDANLPMSLGVPAVTMSGGGTSGGYHSEKLEWWAPQNAHTGPQNAMLTVLGLVGVRGLDAPLAK
ncbi:MULTISPECIES: M20/M25/M40 family metallo-hydrolase [unclassified Duganella]|uniref:M20/M25/M40 family metallo-hydrolase n=1 Tax=unclassified Duganella TaxID=2636909 RepID=UPI0008834ABC|nr:MULTISPECIES: M20/M25/M40 family metallo-hydrolase [unclassified Duganella]SDG78046.1 Acetylornithine deacetylase/Succinyl-diaminopimelate desuccinylase [Duganella sp. OV458]SDK05046.1 Acetylornithine deacetylase/Succinyl-diaminopimelate desuccinylase [Duganella sp. OV510]